MKKHKLFLLIAMFIFVTLLCYKILPLYFSKPSTSSIIKEGLKEKRGNPSCSWEMGSDMLPHMKVYFWVPKTSIILLPYADKNVKTYVTGHGTILRWHVLDTGITTEDEKLVYISVPKTFVFFYGKNFYRLIHLYYE